jgi:hypothetical protein
MKVLIALTLLFAGFSQAADAPGSDIIGGPNSPGGKVPVLKYFPNVYVRIYKIFVPDQALCSLIVSTTLSDTPAGQVSSTTTQVVCPK